jgi:hypothetical protein
MERLKELNLSAWTKEDLIDLLEDYPTLFEMTDGELNKLSRERYQEAQGLIDQANRLESDADAIVKYVIERRRKLNNK